MKVLAPARPVSGVHEALRSADARPLEGGGLGGLPHLPLPDPADQSRAPRDFRAFYDAWFEEVARWIRALGGAEADRDDIVQEVFLVVRRRLGAFDGTNPAGWLYRITRRQVRDFRRRSWVKHIFTKRRVEDPDALQSGAGEPSAALERQENQRILLSILGKIREERRTTFVLFEIEGLSGEEIARIQSVPVNTVWTRLYHARKDFAALAARFREAQRRSEAHRQTKGDA
jgi:RNA polymerase sigma-70 factor, ECF subfamily